MERKAVSGIMLTLLLTGMLVLAFDFALWNAKADLNGDGYVGGIDVGIAGLHLFQSLP